MFPKQLKNENIWHWVQNHKLDWKKARQQDSAEILLL